MLLEQETALLKKLPIFKGIDPCRLKVLCFASARRTFQPGEELFHEGDPSFGAYAILSGSVDVHKSDDDSHTVKSGSDDAIAIVGQSSMLYDSPRKATVTALSEVEALRINSECFMQLVTSCRKSSERTMQSLSAQLVESEARQPLRAD